MTKKIAITGIGLLDNLGSNPSDCISSYLSDEVVIAEDSRLFANKKSLRKPDQMKTSMYASLYDINKMAFDVVEQCLDGSNLGEDVFTLFSTLTAGNPDNVKFSEDVINNNNTFRPRKLIQGSKDFVAGYIPMIYNFRGGSTGFNSACATGLYQLDYAFHLTEDYEYVLCGSAEYGNNPWDMHFFKSLGAIGSQSRPFCETRDGFVMGEGASCLLLENVDKAIARGANILGYLHKPALATDGNDGNVVAPSDKGITSTMKKVLGNIDTDQISFVNAHATSTPAGDEVEYYAIENLLPETPVVSFKSKIGHTLGSSSINEIIYSLMALNNNVIPTNHNIISCEFKNVSVDNKYSDKKMALKNSLGFGGKCGSIIVESK